MLSSQDTILREGNLRKRGGRYYRWTNRYVYLTGPKLSYKLKKDSTNVRGTFDLAPGCLVTEVHEENTGALKGKKIFVFWVVWPHDKNSKHVDDKTQDTAIGDDSDDDDHPDQDKPAGKLKHLKEIVEGEVKQQRIQQQKVEEQLERHQAHDKNVGLGAKVAAVAVGGVVVGALTAGLGLIPYMTVVGVAVVAGGGAVAFQYRRPSDSRLILASDSMHDALAWKAAIEAQISQLDVRPMLPASADPNVISNIIGISTGGGLWRKTAMYEAVRVMEQVNPSEGTRCMKAQVFLKHTPFSAFLSLMDGKHWPKDGSVKVLRSLDDHADLLSVQVHTNCELFGGKKNQKNTTRNLVLSRFWKLDDDGVYLIAINSAKEGDFSHLKDKSGAPAGSVEQPSINAVLTVSPRKDAAEYDDDITEALVTCTCQVSESKLWEKGELEAFMHTFLTEHLVDLRQALMLGRFNPCATVGVGIIGAGVQDSYTAGPSSRVQSTYGDGIWRDNYGSSSTTSPAHGALSPSTATIASRGIATTQPGLEDATQTVSPGGLVPPAAKKRFLFRRALTGGSGADKAQEIAAAVAEKEKVKAPLAAGSGERGSRAKSPAMDRGRALSPTRRAVSPGPMRPTAAAVATVATAAVEKDGVGGAGDTGARKRSSSIGPKRDTSRKSMAQNSEASNLRARIAAKEYLVQRLEKEMKRKDAAAAGTGLTNQHPQTTAQHELFTPMPKQLEELAALKEEYLKLTGIAYEQSTETKRRRRLLGYWKSSSSQAAPVADSHKPMQSHATATPPPPHGHKSLSKESSQRSFAVAAAAAAVGHSLTSDLRSRSGSDSHERALRRPMGSIPQHWLIPTRSLRCDPNIFELMNPSESNTPGGTSYSFSQIGAAISASAAGGDHIDDNSSARSEIVVNIALVLFFGLSIAATMFLATVVSSL